MTFAPDARQKLALVLVVPAISLLGFAGVRFLDTVSEIRGLSGPTDALEVEVIGTDSALDSIPALQQIWEASTKRFVEFSDLFETSKNDNQNSDLAGGKAMYAYEARNNISSDAARIQRFTESDFRLLLRCATSLSLLLRAEDSIWISYVNYVRAKESNENDGRKESPLIDVLDAVFAWQRADRQVTEAVKALQPRFATEASSLRRSLSSLRARAVGLQISGTLYRILIGISLAIVLYLCLEALGVRLRKRASSLILRP